MLSGMSKEVFVSERMKNEPTLSFPILYVLDMNAYVSYAYILSFSVHILTFLSIFSFRFSKFLESENDFDEYENEFYFRTAKHVLMLKLEEPLETFHFLLCLSKFKWGLI